jgi:SAM-dependent methyltransferase
MLAPARLPATYLEWNRRWGAPGGYRFALKLPVRVRLAPLLGRYLGGMFSIQSNSASREFEYPWAWDMGQVRPGMTCVDVGAGHSGFPFVLSKNGADSRLVDPFLQFCEDRHYEVSPASIVGRMNRAFGTHVQLVHDTLDHARLPDASVDRLFCISALEHMPDDAIDAIAREARRILKPGGRFVLTIDLFLDIIPFAAPERNQFGRNIDVRAFIESTGLKMEVGNPSELYGYQEFDAAAIKTHLRDYLVSRSYPVLTQCVVLTRPAAAR